MIESLTMTNAAEAKLSWAAGLDYFKKNPVTQFKPGLNIVFGPNGSGKSTLLELLGMSLAAVQGGTSVVTQSWMTDILGFGGSGLKLPCQVVHDGQPIMYFHARAQEGLIGGSFDDDFMDLGIANCMRKGSTGQLGMARMTRMLEVLMGETTATKVSPRKGKVSSAPDKTGFPDEIVWKMSRASVNDVWKSRIAAIEAMLSASCPVGPKTLLFDEPESGYALPWQAGLWRNVFRRVDPEKFQVIVATHSPFALEIPGAHYIEMQPQYAHECFVTLLAEMADKAPWMFKGRE